MLGAKLVSCVPIFDAKLDLDFDDLGVGSLFLFTPEDDLLIQPKSKDMKL